MLNIIIIDSSSSINGRSRSNSIIIIIYHNFYFFFFINIPSPGGTADKGLVGELERQEGAAGAVQCGH